MLQSSGITLHQNQKQIVQHVNGPLAIFAGPGSGKTTVLTSRVLYQWLVAGIPPNQLLVMTFTKAASKEMKERIIRLLPASSYPPSSSSMTIGTFHSVILKILMKFKGKVPFLLTERDQRVRIHTILQRDCRSVTDDQIDRWILELGRFKSRLAEPPVDGSAFSRQYALYEQQNQKDGKWDFDDILVEGYRFLIANPTILQKLQRAFQYISVDEFQDVNEAQFRIVQLLASHQNLCVVGDDDQSIYGFRGASPDYLLQFHLHYPSAKTIVLTQNYRSSEAVIQLSQRLIVHNSHRHPKSILGIERSGTSPRWIQPRNEKEEVRLVGETVKIWMSQGILPSQIALLYRSSYQAQNFRALQTQSRVNALDHPGLIDQLWVVRDLLAYIRLALDPSDLTSLQYVINRPNRGFDLDTWVERLWHISRGTKIDYLKALSQFPDIPPVIRDQIIRLQFYTAAIRTMSSVESIAFIRDVIGYDRYMDMFVKHTRSASTSYTRLLRWLEEVAVKYPDPTFFSKQVSGILSSMRSHENSHSTLQMMTYHKSKGLEFAGVILVGVTEDQVPHRKSQSNLSDKEDWIEEERRLFYVALTRSKDLLLLSSPRTIQGVKQDPSRFLKQMGF